VGLERKPDGASRRAIERPSADLGGSSEDSVGRRRARCGGWPLHRAHRHTEDWSGVGFHVNSTWTWGSRS